DRCAQVVGQRRHVTDRKPRDRKFRTHGVSVPRPTIAKVTAAAAPTFSESTSGAIGRRTRASAAAIAGADRPGPSAPNATATRSGTSSVQMSIASEAGVIAQVVYPADRNVSTATWGHSCAVM